MSSELSVKQKFRIGHMLSLLCFYVFCIFFPKSKIRDFYVFCRVSCVFSNYASGQSRDPAGCRCVWYVSGGWTNDGCRVVNNLLLGVDRHVDCKCERPLNAAGYAVLVETPRPPSTVGYTVWFHVSCCICIVSCHLSNTNPSHNY